MIGKALFSLVLFFTVTTAPALAVGPEGVWLRASGTSKIKIFKCGSAYCGDLVWLKSPLKDIHNPDKAKRTRPLLGSRTVLGMKEDGKNAWKGKVYNAEDGKTYTGKMKLIDQNRLSLKGCVLGGLFCKGEEWARSK
ncbi:DUF2147 domain-containing protein [Polycladidibacter hongkongensis]|uniref:DUF2147 domain-containing protein n=1 Tax=Polycladidibacter hongkongensis TaxID=1647556 RepID=UPI0008372A81|nr:DUF2147 domain-containing protein [Pseudovibrio hongkongensis]